MVEIFLQTDNLVRKYLGRGISYPEPQILTGLATGRDMVMEYIISNFWSRNISTKEEMNRDL
ncbi:MAG TPA: hypothetical protein VJG67_02580 [Candidatus Paceibacterota bacterium]